MFEAAELGREITKKHFDEQEPVLRSALLVAQRKLREAGIPVIVIISGVEGAGKSEVVNRLDEWLDARGVETSAFWDESDEERERPEYWRYWRAMPARGRVGIFFGSWYTQPIVRLALGERGQSEFSRGIGRIVELERMLVADGALIVKLWFHLSRAAQKTRLKKAGKGDRRRALTPYEVRFAKNYKKFLLTSEAALRATDTGDCPWYIIEATDRRYRDLTAGQTLLQAIEDHLKHRAHERRRPGHRETPVPASPEARISILDRVDLASTIDRQSYEKKLDKLQSRLNQLSWQAWKEKLSTIAVFEGWDAAGKGGAIRRVTGAMDARLYRVVPVAAPTDEELAHHYLWRFWRHLPRAGYVTIFDRSWYGRVLVERVEGFAKEAEWQRSYNEINSFEDQLLSNGTVIAKFWLHLSPEEQLRRFRDREKTPYKQHKITPEDWRNRERWSLYKTAVNDMVTHTSTRRAPWALVPADNKYHARIEILETLCRRIEKALNRR